jgi:hypothetical protein
MDDKGAKLSLGTNRSLAPDARPARINFKAADVVKITNKALSRFVSSPGGDRLPTDISFIFPISTT